MKKETERKYRNLRADIKEWGRCIVAFSGGCDSTLLLSVTADVLGRENVLAVTARSPSFPLHELESARKRVKSLGVEHIEFDTGELGDPNFTSNPENRCYYCKRELFGKVGDIAEKRGVEVIADASNYDDEQKDFRPGLKALEELSIKSPLKDARLTKAEIREISRSLCLPTHDKPSFACLASRFPYGEQITASKLERVGEAELILSDAGFRTFRVRSHGNLARIELGPEEDPLPLLKCHGENTIAARFKALGYVYVALDLEGYRTGSMNEAIGERSFSTEI